MKAPNLVLFGILPALAAARFSPPVHAEETQAHAETPHDYWKEVYSGKRVSTFRFIVSPEDWKSMHPARASRRGPPPDRDSRRGPPPDRPPEPGSPPPPPRRGSKTEFTYVKASMIADGDRYEGVGLRFKGNSSYRFSGESPRKPFKVDTNRFVRGLKYHGETKLNFSTAFKDSTFLKEKLGYDTYRAAGLPTPGVGWARIYLTVEGLYESRYLGLYVLVEQVDDKFIEAHYGEASEDSLLMKPDGLRNWPHLGEAPEKYDATFNIKDGKKNTKLIERFAEFLELIEDASDDVFAKKIHEFLDCDNMASYLAATALMSSLDSFVAAPHNYYILVDAADGKVKILPWDVNEAWATFTLGESTDALTRWDIRRPWVGNRRLLDRLFQLESFEGLYLSKVRALLATFFTEDELFARTQAYRKVVEPLLAVDPFGTGVEGLVKGLEDIENDAAKRDRRHLQSVAVKPFIQRRIASVTRQLQEEESGIRLEGRRRRGPR